MNYKNYRLGRQETIKYFLVYLLISVAISYLFFDSVYASMVFIALFPIFLKKKRDSICERITKELSEQFCEMMESLNTALGAGASVDNAFIIARNEMEKLFGSDAYIFIELEEIVNGLTVNVPVSESLKNLSSRVNDEDIRDFTDIFMQAMRTGGNLNEIIRNTVFIMRDKKRTEDEIAAMLKGKVLEQRIMCVIPILIFVYLRIFSSDFIRALYHNPAGIAVMSVCLLVYAASYISSERIVNIKV